MGTTDIVTCMEVGWSESINLLMRRGAPWLGRQGDKILAAVQVGWAKSK